MLVHPCGLVRLFVRVRAVAAVLVLLLAPRISAAATINVPAGGDLQAAINAAQPGDSIHLEPGATYIGNFLLPVKSGATYIVIRTAPDPLHPLPGDRVTPAHAPRLAKLRSPNGDATVMTAAGAHHWRLELLDIGPTVGAYGETVRLGRGGSDQNTLASVPYEIVIDRCYIHGDPLLGQKRGIGLNSAATTVINSYISEIKGVGMDTQAICGWNGPGPFVIANNYLEGAGENVMFGGADPYIRDLVPTDITFRGNHLSKPRTWQQPIIPTPSPAAVPLPGAGTLAAGTYAYRVVARRPVGQGSMGTSAASADVTATLSQTGGVSLSWAPIDHATEYRVYGRTAGSQTAYWTVTGTTFVDTGANGTAGAPPAAGSRWTVKNIFELKNARRVTIEGNVFEHSWRDAQIGVGVVMTPRNDGGNAPWATVQDITFRYNLIRHVGGAINVNGYDTVHPSGPGRNFLIQHNLAYDVRAEDGMPGRFLTIGSGPSNLVVDHNTAIQNSTLVFAYGRNSDGSYDVVEGFRFSNNLGRHNDYGIMGELAGGYGNTSILTYFLDLATVTNNVLAGGPASRYPADNFFPTLDAFMAEFADDTYRLRPDSTYRAAGNDGLDLGADVEEIWARAERAIRGTSGSNAAPIAAPGGPYAAPTSAPITFDGSASTDPDGSIASYVWTWGDGSPDGTGVSATHAFTSAGTYSVTLTVTDQGGATASASTTATIWNRPPTADAGGPYSGEAGTSLIVSAAGSTDADGNIASYRWSWGDGSADTTVTSATASHVYQAAGDYTISLVVTDDQGDTSVSTTRATIGNDATPSDLLVTALSAPPAAAADSSITVGDTTANAGEGPASEVTIAFYLSANFMIDANSVVLGERTVESIAPDASSQGTTTMQVPASVSAGVYQIFAKVDPQNRISESNEFNNQRVQSISIGPDLGVSAFTAPATAGAGQTINVRDTTTNTGAATAPASVTRFYLSTNFLLDAADPLLSGSRDVPVLAPGQSSTGWTTVTIPDGIVAGYYYVVARADGADQVREAQEANNTRWSGLVQIGADLVISALSAPPQAASGATFAVSDTTTNGGSGAAGPSTTAFYLSANSVLDPSDVRLGDRTIAALTSGNSSSGATSITLPAETPTGVWQLIVVADASAAIPETQEGNNTRLAAIRVGPDLQVTSVGNVPSTRPGANVTITDTVANRGSGPAGASTVRYYLSTNALLDASDELLAGGRDVPALAANESSTGSTSLTIPAGTAPGFYYVFVLADAAGVVSESLEQNNSMARSIHIRR
jgi:subtilase family serine protease